MHAIFFFFLQHIYIIAPILFAHIDKVHTRAKNHYIHAKEPFVSSGPCHERN